MKSLLDLPESYLRPEWRTCVVPGRPWWIEARVLVRDPLSTYAKRRDGHTVVLPPWQRESHAEREASLREACEAHDAAHPLPEPGYRVGQVWTVFFSAGEDALSRPQTHLVLIDRPHPDWATPLGLKPARVLLHDPCRPDLAPWSSR